MSVNLSKGQKVNLSKQRNGLSKVMVGLGWDEVQQNSGFFGMFKAKPQDIDCDAFAILLGYDGHLINHATKLTDCTVFFNNLRWPNGSIQHMGDNLTGAGEGDDEQIFVDLNNVPYDVGSIVFAVNIYEAFKRNQHFGMIRNAFIRVVRAKGESMIEVGINPGDLVVVHKQNTADEGDIVVALVDNETTLKRFYIDKEHKCVRLHPENKTMKDILVNSCYIQGVAQHVIKAL